MYAKTTALVLGLALLGSACSTLSIHHDYDTSFDFSRLKTFTWPPMMRMGRVDPLNVQRVEAAVKQNLEAKGFTASSSGDFLISLHGDRHAQINLDAWGYGPGWWRAPADVYTDEQGVLVIDIVDAAHRTMIWRGTATEVVDDTRTPEAATKHIDDAVNKILASFPPPKKG